MLKLYTWPTPNGHKIHIMLEECGLDYEVIPIDIGAGDQFTPEFLKISPNNKMPALVDTDGPGGEPLSIFESGAILIYLANKAGKFFPKDAVKRYKTLEWLMWQMGGIGPFLGQAHHFLHYAPEKIPYAMERYKNEARRLYGVLDKRVSENRFLAGDDYTIADMACWPWMRNPDRQGVDKAELPNYVRWHEEIGARPAVQKAIKVLADHQSSGPMSEKAREMLFGKAQYERR